MKNFLFILNFLFTVFVFAQNPDLLNKNWRITKIIWNGIEYYSPNEAFSGNSYFKDNSYNPNILSSYFNGMSGSFTFNNDNTTFYKNSCTCTLADYWGDNGEINQFSGMNCDFFMNANSGIFSYTINSEINSKVLIITNSLGNKIYYTSTNLSDKTPESKKLTIYPNPASDFIFLKNVNPNSSVKIIDTLGKVVINRKINENFIEVKSLPKGTYFLEIEGLKTLKFIKN